MIELVNKHPMEFLELPAHGCDALEEAVELVRRSDAETDTLLTHVALFVI